MSDPKAGITLGRYRLERELGRGGMGVVFLAQDELLQRPVAIKVLATALAADEEFRLRFLREMRMAGALEHPNVVPVYDAGEADGHLYLATRNFPPPLGLSWLNPLCATSRHGEKDDS